MFHHHEKKTKTTHIQSTHHLISIATPVVLLAEARRPALLQNIMNACAMDSARFNNLCMKLLHDFVHHCQRLPETANHYYALPGGLLDHALNRTEAALHLFRQTLVQGSEEALSEEQQLWLYALFSAAILQDIGKLQLDYQIEQLDIHGQLLKQWNPLLTPLSSVGKYYHYEFLPGSEDDLRHRLTVLLAYQLMPESGFAWIASEPNVLATWLALLHGDANAAGVLGAILERADGIAIQRDVHEFLLKHARASGARQGRISTFIDAGSEAAAEKEHLLGAEFIKWLAQEINKGRLVINKAPLMLIQAGLVMSPETYQLFMRDHPEIKHWQAVQKGLLSWGLHRHHADNPAALNQIVLAKYAVVLPEKMQLHQLSLSGEWQKHDTVEPQSGYSHHD